MIAPTLRPLTPADLPEVLAVQRACHPPALQEGAGAFARKLAGFPAGCLGLEADGLLCAYVFCHPWPSGTTMPLDSAATPSGAGDWLYIHDLAVLPARRGAGAAAALLGRVWALAAGLGLERSALVAVQDSGPFWIRQGFRAVRSFEYTPGVGAIYMIRGPEPN